MNTKTMINKDTFGLESFSASELKNKIASVFEHALVAPVRITRRGTKGYVLLLADEYECLELLDDAHWSNIAREARKSRSIGAKATEVFINQKLQNT